MAYTVRLRNSCPRYLSPSRLTSANLQCLVPQTDHSFSGTSTTANLHCTANQLLKPHSPFSSHNFQQSSQSNPFIQNVLSCGFKTKVNSLSETAKPRGGYLDMSSFLRLLSSLHIDLPKGFQWPGKSAQEDNAQTHTEIKHESKDNSKFSANAEHEMKIKEKIPLHLNSNEKMDEKDFTDFTRAMHEQNISVEDYFLHNRHIHQFSDDKEVMKPREKAMHTMIVEQLNTFRSTTNLLKHITSYIPGMSNQKSPEIESSKQKSTKTKLKTVTQRSVVDRKTRGLVKSLKIATSSASKLVRLEDLCRHLSKHPEAKSLAYNERVIPYLLRLRACRDATLREKAMEGLALIGYIDPVKGRGIKILSLDGGGTRGLVAIEMLRCIEQACKKPIHEMFDVICGVSTGSLIGILLGVHKLSLDETEHLYKKFSSEMFNRYKLMGMSKLVVSHGYYDAQLWEKILRENVGLKSFSDSMRESHTPKIIAVSTLMNMIKLSNYLFRNYAYPRGAESTYPGSFNYTFWEAIRASSAAPMYYQEFQLDEWIHQDGGIITNNPTSIAIHEAKLLWPNDSIQCVISLGTGRYEPSLEPQMTSTGLRNKVQKIIQSATDTQAVHTVLHDLLPPSAYYRFNPYMSEEFTLDEIRVDSWYQMQLDTQLYCRKNRYKIQKASQQLLLKKYPHQRMLDAVQLKLDEIY